MGTGHGLSFIGSILNRLDQPGAWSRTFNVMPADNFNPCNADFARRRDWYGGDNNALQIAWLEWSGGQLLPKTCATGGSVAISTTDERSYAVELNLQFADGSVITGRRFTATKP